MTGNGKTTTRPVQTLQAVNWLNIHYENNGYGRYGLGVVRGLLAAGVAVHLQGLDALKLPAWAQGLTGLDFSKPTLTLTTCNRLQPLPGRQWALSMYETTQVPDVWVAKLNQMCERLIVPCEQNAEAFRDSGVEIPIHIVHGGVGSAEFEHPLPRPANRPYTFLTFGDGGQRKGLDLALQAFQRAFSQGEDVRLIIKTRPRADFGLQINEADTPDTRISVWNQDADSLAEVFAHVDCVVFLTRGEGWGLPPREAAYMGLPVITTRWAGTAVNIDQWALPVRTGRLERSHFLGGYWASPDLDEAAAHLRWCYEHPTEARHKGQQAAQWLRTRQTWEQAAQGLLDIAYDATNTPAVPVPTSTLQELWEVLHA